MKEIVQGTLIGMLVGAIVGALALGANQWFIERWQADFAEVEKWVSIAVFMGASIGAIAGALIGFVVGFAKNQKTAA
jgi:hypothetical protein